MRYSMSFVFPLSCGLIALACSSVSNDTKSEKSTPNVEALKPPKDAGPEASHDAAHEAAVDAAPEAAAPATIAFDITTEGAPGPIPATVTTDPVGIITIGAYPSTATATIEYGFLPVGFTGAFSADYCADIQTKAKAANGTTSLAKLNKRYVRQGAAVPLHIVVSPYVDVALQTSASAAAAAAGAPGTAFRIGNPLSINDVGLFLEIDEDALSNIIGETGTLMTDLATSLSFASDTVAMTGAFDTASPAKDLLCDLANGKARISFTVGGTVGETAYTGKTIASHLKAN